MKAIGSGVVAVPKPVDPRKCPVDGCPNSGILYFNETTGRNECFDCAYPRPTVAQAFAGMFDIIKGE